MKSYLIPAVFLCAFSTLFATDYQVKAGGAVTSAATFNVWDGSAWVTATTAPGIGDSITSFANTANLSMPTGESIGNVSVTLSGVASATIIPTSASNEVTISGTVGLKNDTATAQTLTIRSGGTWHIGSLSVVANGNGNTTLNFGSNTTHTVSSLTAGDVTIENNGSGTALLGIHSVGDYSLGVVTVKGSGSGYRQIALLNGTPQENITATVAGISSEYIGATTNYTLARFTIAGAVGHNVNLVIDVAAGKTYTASANFESMGTGDKLNLIKTGAGTQYILTGGSGNISYGSATVSRGDLFVQNSNGKGLTVGNITVENGGRLGMSGALSLSSGNSLTVQDGGTFMVGTNDRRFTLQANNNIVMQDGSNLQFILGKSATSEPLGNVLTLSNGATLTADNITLELLVGNNTQEATYTLINGLASDITGNWTVTTTDANWQAALSYLDGNVSVTMSYIPEPAVAAAFLGALALMAAIRRRR